MDRKPPGQGEATIVRRWAIDLAVLIAIGLMMGFLGPFSSEHVPVVQRYIYWMICMVGGGVIGIVADELLARRVAGTWTRVSLISVLMTPAVALFVMATEHLLVGGSFGLSDYLELLLQVWPILASVMVVRALVWRRTPALIETRTVIAAPPGPVGSRSMPTPFTQPRRRSRRSP